MKNIATEKASRRNNHNRNLLTLRVHIKLYSTHHYSYNTHNKWCCPSTSRCKSPRSRLGHSSPDLLYRRKGQCWSCEHCSADPERATTRGPSFEKLASNSNSRFLATQLEMTTVSGWSDTSQTTDPLICHGLTHSARFTIRVVISQPKISLVNFLSCFQGQTRTISLGRQIVLAQPVTVSF